MTGFAYIQKGTYSAAFGATITLATIPPGSYGTNPSVVVALAGSPGSGGGSTFLTDNLRNIKFPGLPSSGIPGAVTQYANEPIGQRGVNDSFVVSPHGIRDLPAHVPPIISPLDSGTIVTFDAQSLFSGSSGIFWIGVMSYSAGQDARNGGIDGTWIPRASLPTSVATAWDITRSHDTGTLHNLPAAVYADPWDPTAGGASSSMADQTFPVAIGFYLGSATSGTPSIPTWVGDPSLLAWQDIDSIRSGNRVISVGLYTRALAGLDSLGRPNGNFDVSNMPALSHATDAWGIILVTTGKGIGTSGRSWAAVIS